MHHLKKLCRTDYYSVLAIIFKIIIMIGKLLTFILIISIIEVCLAVDEQTEAPYICKSARCLYGAVDLISLKTEPNPLYSADGEGENITLTVKDELTFVTQEYVNWWIRTSDDSEPQGDAGLWGTICVEFKDLVRSARSRYGISHRVTADLFRVYETCPTEPMTFKPGRGFEGGFELERKRPPGPVFQYILTIGNSGKFEEAYLTAIWKVTVKEEPDSSTEPSIETSSMDYTDSGSEGLSDSSTEPESELGTSECPGDQDLSKSCLSVKKWVDWGRQINCFSAELNGQVNVGGNGEISGNVDAGVKLQAQDSKCKGNQNSCTAVWDWLNWGLRNRCCF